MKDTAETAYGPAYDPADPVRNDATYTAVLRAKNLVRAAEMLAEGVPGLETPHAPPVQHLLEIARDELDKLAERVSP